MSVENSRSKRSLPDIADDPAPGYDAQEYSSVVASTSTHVVSPCTKRGTHQPVVHASGPSWTTFLPRT